jgi:hypothetical protein
MAIATTMATATPITMMDGELSAIGDFRELAKALGDAMEICERLEAAGYPNASILSSALTIGNSLPDLVDYVEQVTEQARVAQLCGWDLGATCWWSHRVEGEDTIDHIRILLSGEPGHLAAFESFNEEFEKAYPALGQALSMVVARIHSDDQEESGRDELPELRPALEAALGKLVADRGLTWVRRSGTPKPTAAPQLP